MPSYPQTHLKQYCGDDFEYWLDKYTQFADWSLVPSQNHPHIIYIIIIYMRMSPGRLAKVESVS